MAGKVRCGVAAVWLAASAAMAVEPVTGPGPGPGPVTGPLKGPDERAAAAVAAMTQEEKLRLVFGYFGADHKGVQRPPDSIPYSAGFIPGVPRLGLPPQLQTDSGIGVSTQRTPVPRERTSLPSGLAVAATWNPQRAYEGGAMIGKEARQSGHNVMLGGSVNLLREPRNGRNFEYAGEDPLLAGTMAGEQIRGIQSNHVMSTVKHFALNDQETKRFTIDARISDPAARMSDLLAFQFAIERGDPGAVMCAYNRVNGAYACESDYLLNQVLRRDWGYKGFVMSDWGATHSTVQAAMAGLDQQSGWPFDKSPYFREALQESVENGHVPAARLDQMAHRIVRSMFAHGLVEHPAPPASDAMDFDANAAISQAAAEEGIVLLKNAGGLLPLAPGVKRIAVIGGHADKGVLSGGGSAVVYPKGGNAVPDEGPAEWPGPVVYLPSPPLQALRQRSQAAITYHDGRNIASAARLAAASDIAIVFATQWTTESQDVPDLSLPKQQDGLIAAVALANPRTVVVLETGGPVAMPWLPIVPAVLAAWYPGSAGGTAIARVLAGDVNPSGRLPATFPASESQLPRPRVDRGDTVDYDIEGAAVGYKWFERTGRKPLFAFGHGLSYTTFGFGGLQVAQRDGKLVARFAVQNTGRRDGAAVAQVYVAPKAGGWEAPQRLGGWAKLALKAGERGEAEVEIDPRLLAVFSGGAWRIAEGEYVVTLAEASDRPVQQLSVRLAARSLPLALAPR